MGTAEFGSSEAGKKGGRARAERLTPEERSAIAREASRVRWGKADTAVLNATHEGVLRIGEAEFPCAVLSDGTRVLSRIQFLKAIGRTGKAKGGRRYDDEFKTPVFLTANNLKPYISLDLMENSTPIPYRSKSGTDAIGYRAELMPGVCAVFVDADGDGVLHTNQKHIAARCRILLRGLATVGIIALVDEATGHERDKKRDELAAILSAFVAKEFQKYLKTFDLEFYELICELRGEPLERATRRPKYFGHITNNLVFDRLAPGVRQELQRLNPADERGRRKVKLYNYFTPDIGHPKLKAHLEGVTTGMKFAKLQGLNWDQFLGLLNKTHPKYKPMPLFDQAADESGE